MRASTGLAVALCAAVGACAGGDDPPRGERPGGPAQSGVAPRGGQALIDAQVAMARCLRRQGIDVPDPTAGRGFELDPGSSGADRLRRAEGRCKAELRAIADAVPKPSAAQLREDNERTLRFARCMRRHGADVPDPRASAENPGGTAVEVPPDAKTDPAFQRASRSCERLLRERR